MRQPYGGRSQICSDFEIPEVRKDNLWRSSSKTISISTFGIGNYSLAGRVPGLCTVIIQRCNVVECLLEFSRQLQLRQRSFPDHLRIVWDCQRRKVDLRMWAILSRQKTSERHTITSVNSLKI